MMSGPYEALKIENQLCFPLYAGSKEVVKRYKPLLDELDLTYTQYITMMVLWDKGELNVGELGKILYLDSGTLTPVLKALEKKGFVSRTRSSVDERVLIASPTEEGMRLRDRALKVPGEMFRCVDLSPEDARTLYRLLYKLLGNLSR